MLANVRTLMEHVHRLDENVRPLKGKQVFKTAIRQGAEEIVDAYLREHRDPLAIAGISNVKVILAYTLETAANAGAGCDVPCGAEGARPPTPPS